MSDRLALLRGILANPDDDLRRLVYADWLDDHGTTDADKARAEFIRLGCKMKAKTAITPKEGKWLDANWARLLPTIVTSPHRRGRVLHVHLIASQRDGHYWFWSEMVFARGFATAISFNTRNMYEESWRTFAEWEPLALLMPMQGTRQTINPEDWGQEVFDQVPGSPQSTGRTKRIGARPPADIPDTRGSRSLNAYRTTVALAMTAIAREYTGLTPAPEA